MGFRAYQLWQLGPLPGLAPNSVYFKYLILQNIATAMIANVMCTNPSTCNQSRCDQDSRQQLLNPKACIRDLRLPEIAIHATYTHMVTVLKICYV